MRFGAPTTSAISTPSQRARARRRRAAARRSAGRCPTVSRSSTMRSLLYSPMPVARPDGEPPFVALVATQRSKDEQRALATQMTASTAGGRATGGRRRGRSCVATPRAASDCAATPPPSSRAMSAQQHRRGRNRQQAGQPQRPQVVAECRGRDAPEQRCQGRLVDEAPSEVTPEHPEVELVAVVPVAARGRASNTTTDGASDRRNWSQRKGWWADVDVDRSSARANDMAR